MNPTTTRLEAFSDPESGYQWHTCYAHDGDAGYPVRVIDHPGVYLVASMRLHDDAVNRFLDNHQIATFKPWGEKVGSDLKTSEPDRNGRGTDQELAVELSGRICYMSYERPRPGGLQAFLDRLKSEGHGSVFEHAHYSFILTGVSRNMTLESNRHRHFAISQLSGRFVDANSVGFVADPDQTPDEERAWALRCLEASRLYNQKFDANYDRYLKQWGEKTGHGEKTLQELNAIAGPVVDRKLTKKARERARDILPGCLETRIFYTVNARAIRLVFEKRCHADAAFEIRRCFNGVYRALKAHDPKLFSDYSETPLDDGTFAVSTSFGKI